VQNPCPHEKQNIKTSNFKHNLTISAYFIYQRKNNDETHAKASLYVLPSNVNIKKRKMKIFNQIDDDDFVTKMKSLSLVLKR
jgi:hypothetical protein